MPSQMTTITIQNYHERIEKLIDDNMLTDAVAHCRHILESHPSHIATYRLLAKALLEQNDYDGASDLFQRVLSADPNDFVAHVGLSIVRAEESQVESALWHLQRAFEIQPYSPVIQEELRRHYAQFSDMAVGRIPLTSGALARLYIKGELYQQAVQELRQTLYGGQDRIDLEVLLAEALWRNEQRVDAEEVCLSVLQRLPNCIAVNAILSEIWLQTGRIGESQKYLRRLINLTSLDKESLDMDTAVGRAFRADGAPPLPDKVEIEFKGDGLAPLPAEAATAAKGPSADWMNDVTFDSDMGDKFDYKQLEVTAESPSGMHNYDWMADVNDDLVAQEGLPLESEWFVDEGLQAEPSLEEDWLADVGLAGAGTAVADSDFDLLFADEDMPLLEPEAAAPEPEDWFLAQSESELQPEESFASEQLAPDWLVSLVDEPDVSDESGELAEADVSSDWFASSHREASLSAAESNMPDWLSNLVDDGQATRAASDFAEVELAPAAAGDQDDWLIDQHAEDHWNEADYTPETMPDWLQGATMPEASDATTAEPVAEDDWAVAEEPPTAQAAEMPDWLRKQTGELDLQMTASVGSGEFDGWSGGDEPAPPAEESLFTGWLSDEPEAPAAVKGAAALGLTAMFASLDDDLPAVEETPAADEWDDLFTGVDDLAAPPVASAIEDETVTADTAVSLNDLRSLFADDTVDDAAEMSLESDWLAPVDDVWADDLAADLLADDLADLRAETTDVAAELAQTFGGQFYLDDDLAEAEEEEIPDWLLGKDEARLGKAEEMGMGMMGDEDDAALPEWPQAEDDFASLKGDWLSEFTTGGDEELPDDETLDVTPAVEGVPDWLAGFDLDAADQGAEAEEEEWLVAAAPPAAMDADLPEAEALPDWLSDFAATAVADEPPTVPVVAVADEEAADEEADELFDVLAGMSAAESPLADWLADDEFALFADEPDETTRADTAVPAGGLTAWLSSLPEDESAQVSEPEPAAAAVADIPEIPSEELFATDQENLPDWLAPATGELIVTADEESNLPDWLMGDMDDVPAALDSDSLFATDAADEMMPMAELDELEADLMMADDELPVAEAAAGLTAVGLTALLSSVDDDLTTVAGLDAEAEMDWLADMAEEPATAFAVADEVELDWLADETVVAEVDMAEKDTAEKDTAVSPEQEWMDAGPDASAAGLDEAISWLEELASQQETPVEELPTVAETLLAEELVVAERDTLAHQEMMAEDFDAGFDEALDEAWAEAFPAEMTAVPAGVDVPVAEEDAAEESWLDVLLADEEAEAAELAAPPEDDEEAAMAWLEGLAAKQGASLDELPTQQGRSQPDLDGLVDEAQADLDEALAWMDNLAGEAETKEEWPELDEELLATMMTGATAASAAKTAGAPELDEELLAELDSLAEQVKSEGITPVVSDGTAVVSDVELMMALDWLEETEGLAQPPDTEAELTSDDEWFTAEVVEIEDVVEMATVADVAEMTEAVEMGEEADLDLMADLAVDDLLVAADRDEPWEDETWDWEQPKSITDLLSVTALAPASPPVEEVEEDLDLLDMPDDPDEAMEWLARFATPGADETEILAPSLSMAAPAEVVADEEMEDVWEESPGMVLPMAVADAVPDDVLDAVVLDETDMLLMADDMDINEIPDDPEAALDWLLHMAEGDAAIDFDMQPPPITPSEDAKFAVAYDEPAIEPEMEVVEEMDTAVAEPDLMADETTIAGLAVEEDEGWLEDMLLILTCSRHPSPPAKTLNLL